MKKEVEIPDIELDPDVTRIQENRAALDRARQEVNSLLTMVNALARANQMMCRHPRTRSDGWGGGDCPDCGWSY